MDAVRYIVECDRMCRSFSNCQDCPIRARVSFGSCEQFKINNPKETVAIVETWSAEHPKKTRLQDFLEKHPNAPLGIEGFPWMRPVNMGYCNRRNCVGCDMQYSETSKLCWNLPVEE